jgi:hypothetical protein
LETAKAVTVKAAATEAMAMPRAAGERNFRVMIELLTLRT